MGEPGFVRNRGDKEAHARFPLGRAFACAGCGIRHAFATQRNMRIHAAVAVAAVVLGVVLGIDAPSWAAVVLCIAGVMAAECANTAIEAVVDLVTDDYAELARVAKDCAAGAVYLMAIGAVAVGAIVYGARALALLGL
ncbi:diacylglycerol kinase family protein [Adlercreutzia faecimuris]|uniref:Diacylglycerol kinase family protein n=1 Tax=Adlercreutzia faecimuris TaxID=2897341 RepID=A0ABS9WGK4_9ACTN|nr:diacylglycerol kinase family protein [Adlercreutzia sp. JBNU-10]MCI2241929.1 diacylglycerol kinase family protein [Adlercreutzia sp. JBNU-10]